MAAARPDQNAEFATRLGFLLKALGWSRGRLAVELAVDKSVVSRWLSGATVPGDHNLSRLSSLIARHVPGFSMLDWDLPLAELSSRVGVAPPTAPAPPADAVSFDLGDLPSLAAARIDTGGRARRYCGLWRLLRPMMAQPDSFVCEHLVISREAGWLRARVHNIISELPAKGFLADGQLYLFVSVQNALVTLLFNRVDDPIIDQIDGLILSPTVKTGQTPCASRIVLQRMAHGEPDEAEVSALLAAHAAERRIVHASDMPPDLAAALLPESGPAAHARGGDRLLRAATDRSLIRSRWS